MNDNKSACTYKEDIKTNFESSLSMAGHFPFGTCSLEYILSQDNKTWKHYLQMNKEDQVKLEKEANKLVKSMMFVFGCKNNGMHDNLKRMSLYENERYPQTIEAACNIYQNQYEKKKQEITNIKEMKIVSRIMIRMRRNRNLSVHT